ncbi:MAG: dihydrolipoamide acetyltransferase family protein [Nitrososphaerales archaeon]
MVVIVRLPKLTWTMEEGLITRWLKNEGEMVNEGEVICEIETEKTVDEIKAPSSGILRKILIQSGNVAKVNQAIAIIGSPDEPLPELIEFEERRIKISPVAKKLAEEYKLDVTKIKGTGPEGRITREDVLRAIGELKEKKIELPGRLIPLSRMRKTIADRLSLSARSAIHVPITMDVDMYEVKKILDNYLESGFKVTYTDVLIKVVATALKEYQKFNALFTENGILYVDNINIGVAVATDDGLIVPVIHNADNLNILEISKRLDELIEKARGKKLTTKETSGGTFTISNLGMYDVQMFAPIINPPEVAILGVGRVMDKPVVINGEITVRPTLTLTLVFDHRVADGAEAAKFLQRIKNIIEKPFNII